MAADRQTLSYRLRAWLRALIDPGSAQRDVDDEIAYHLTREIERHVANGETHADAVNAARRAFGNPTLHREHTRDALGPRTLEHVAHDLRYAIRTLCQTPAYTAVVVASLAVGVG